jgi:hypothetical protein
MLGIPPYEIALKEELPTTRSGKAAQWRHPDQAQLGAEKIF